MDEEGFMKNKTFVFVLFCLFNHPRNELLQKGPISAIIIKILVRITIQNRHLTIVWLSSVGLASPWHLLAVPAGCGFKILMIYIYILASRQSGRASWRQRSKVKSMAVSAEFQ